MFDSDDSGFSIGDFFMGMATAELILGADLRGQSDRMEESCYSGPEVNDVQAGQSEYHKRTVHESGPVNFVEAKCKSCGAPLKVNEAMTMAVCPYCKAMYIIDKNEKVTSDEYSVRVDREKMIADKIKQLMERAIECEKMGVYHEAVDCCEAVLKLDGNYREAREHILRDCKIMADWHEARDELEEAVRWLKRLPDGQFGIPGEDEARAMLVRLRNKIRSTFYAKITATTGGFLAKQTGRLWLFGDQLMFEHSGGQQVFYLSLMQDIDSIFNTVSFRYQNDFWATQFNCKGLAKELTELMKLFQTNDFSDRRYNRGKGVLVCE